MGDKSAGEGPPPPSPLTGAYLLIVLPQTHQLQHKDNVIHNLTKGLLTWDKNDCHVDLEKELQTITAQAPDGEEAKNGERLIQFASENLVTEVLIHPQLNTLVQCMRNLLSSFTRHRHIIHAGYTCAGNGAWLLQDGTYSYADFVEMYQEHEVQRILRAYESSVTVDVHCLQEGDWNNLRGKDPFSKNSRVRLNPKDCMTSSPALKAFLDYLTPYVSSGSIEELLESSDVVGNIRFSHPTLYVFPGGQGDAALFGINGFNMLVDGGFARKACFWDFSRHLDRLDAVLMTRLNNSNIQGLTSLLQRKRMDHVYPQIGHFFCNLQERKHPLSPDGDKDKDPLLVSLFDQGHDILASLRHLQLKPQPCYRDPMLEPVNLYHKVGHGKLDMYVISPAKDSREVREFMAKWTTQDSKIFCSFTKRGGEFQLPLCNKVSICALLVWQPANPEDNITRLLFPGSTPQHKIFEGLDRLKSLEFMKHPVCSARTLSPSSSSVGLNIRAISKPKVPASVDKIIENEDKKIEAVKQPIMKPPSGQVEKPQTKPTPPVSRAPSKQKSAEKPKEKPKTEVEVKSEKPETAKTEKAKPEKIEKTEAVQKIEKPKEKPKRPITKQPERKKPPQPVGGEKKDSLKSSPTTPKKIGENKLTESKVSDTKTETPPKPEVKSRASSRTKPSPSATPAKSAKEANNRKVLEQKKEATKRVPLAKKEEAKKPEKPMASRKSVPSPSRGEKQQLSPVKAPRPVTRPKQDAKKAMKTEKDAVTESVVSTPSTVDVELAKAKDDLAEKETKVEVAEATELPSLSKDDEDEILVVEKIEIEGDDKTKPEESIAVHIRNSREDIADGVEIKEEVAADQQSDEKKEVMKTSDVTIQDTDSKPVSEDVQDITKDAPDTSKSRVEFLVTEEASITKEAATDKLTPKEKDAKEKSTDVGDVKQTDESQPDEKFSTTVESGATTAPTLPEDERIPLDEIKEQIEEKHVKEETKEKEVGAAPRPEQPTSLPEVPVIHSTPFDQRVHLLKDIVKTPDEVADLPMHEEADGGLYAVDDQGQLCKDFQKSKEDLLNIPAKKPSEKKEDEEVKLVKDENEKEDVTKDLKEDDALLVDKATTSTEVIAKEKVPVESELEPAEKDADQKTLETLAKQDSGLEQDDEEIKEIEHIDNELAKSSIVPPVSQEDEEVLDEDKDKETEKEKLLRNETEKEVEENEEKTDKEKPVEKEEKGTIEIGERKEGTAENEPITKDGSQEDEKEMTGADVDRKSSIEEERSPQAAQEEKKIEDASGKIEESVEKDGKIEAQVTKSPEPQAGKDASPEKQKLSETPSTQPEVATAKSPEPQTISKSPSPEPVAAVAKSPELEKLSPVPVDIVEVNEKKSAKSPSPQPQNEVFDTKQNAKAPSPVPESQSSDQAMSEEPAVGARKSPSPEKDAGLARSPEPSGKVPEPKEDSVQVDVPLKSSKSPSPEPTADSHKDESSEVKSTSPETQVKSPIAKSPSPEPEKDSSPSPDKAKSPSQDPQPILDESPEPPSKHSKSPSPEPKTDAAKLSSPDEGKSPVPDAKISKSPSPEPKTDAAKLSSPDVGKSPVPDAKISKSPSPEPKTDAAKLASPDEGKSPVPDAKISKSPSPEPKTDAAKLSSPDKGKSPLPDAKISKSPSPEPKTDAAKLSSPDEGKSPVPGAKISKSPSPEPKTDAAKLSSPDEGKSPVPDVKMSKSPSPDLKEKISDLESHVSKTPTPEPLAEAAKSPEPGVKTSKPTTPEPHADAKMPESPVLEPTPEEHLKSLSPEQQVTEEKEVESTEPIVQEAKPHVVDTQISKSPQPVTDQVKSQEHAPKVSKSPSPEPQVDLVAKSLEPETKESKSTELLNEVAKSPEPVMKVSKSPSPELEDAQFKAAEPIATSVAPEGKVAMSQEAEIKLSKPPSVEPAAESIDSVKAESKASKSPSPEPAVVVAKFLEAEIDISKMALSEPIDEAVKSLESDGKAPKSPSPDSQAVLAKSPELSAKDAPALSSGPEETLIIGSEPKETLQRSIIEVPASLEAEIKMSKSPSPEPAAEVVKSLDTEIKSPKSPSPEPGTLPTKPADDVIDASNLPQPSADTVTSVDGEIEVSKPPLSVSTIEAAKSLATETSTSKSPSPEPKADTAKSVETEIQRSSKSPSPEPTHGSVKPLEATIRSSKSPSPEPVAEAANLDVESKTVKSPSPEPLPETTQPSEATLQTKSPSPEPKPETDKSLVAGSKASKSPSPEPTTTEMVKPLDVSKITISKSPSPEPTSESVNLVKDDIKASKSPSPEPITETAKSVDIETKTSKPPSPEPLPGTAQSLEAALKTSKSPSPEPRPETDKSVDVQSKTSKSPSPEPNTEIAKSLDPKIDVSKSASPEPTVEFAKVEDDIKASKSPSPEPIAESAKSLAGLKTLKTPSPEPTTETTKSLEADINTSKSPSPEPAGSAKSPENVKTQSSLLEQDPRATESTTKLPSPEPATGLEKLDNISKSPSPLPSEPEESTKDLPELAKCPKSPSPEPLNKVSELVSKVDISKSPSPEPIKEDVTSHKKDDEVEKEDKGESESKPDDPHQPKDESGKAEIVESSIQDVSNEASGRVQIDHEFDDLPGEMRKDEKVPSLSLREASVEQHSEEGSLPRPSERKQSSGEVSTKSQEAEDKDVQPSATSPVGSDRSEARKSGQISPLPKDSKSPSPEPFAKTEVESDENPDTVSGKVSPLSDGILKDSEQSSGESKESGKIEIAEPTVDVRKSSLDASPVATEKGSVILEESKVDESLVSESSVGERKLSGLSLKESLKDEAVLLDKDASLSKDDVPESSYLLEQELDKSEEVVLGKLIIAKEEVVTSVTGTSKVASPEPADEKLSLPEKKQLEEDSKSQISDEKQGFAESGKRDSLESVKEKSKTPSPEPKIDTKYEVKSESKPQETSEIEVHTDEMKVSSVLSKSPSPTPSLSEKEGKHPEERETVSPAPSERSTAEESVVDGKDEKSPSHEVKANELPQEAQQKKDSLKDGKLSPEVSKSPSPPTVQDSSVIEVPSKSPEPTTEKQEISSDKKDSTEVKPDEQVSVKAADVKPPCDSKSPEASLPLEKKSDAKGHSEPSPPCDDSLSKKDESKSDALSDSKVLGHESEESYDKESDKNKTEAAPVVKLELKHDEKTEDVVGSVAAEIQSVIEMATESVTKVLEEKTEAGKSAIPSVLGDEEDSKDSLTLHSKSPSPSKDETLKGLPKGTEGSPTSGTELSDVKMDASVSVITEQVCFATSSTDLKHPLESAEPLDIGDTSIVKFTAKESTEKDPDELTSATISKADESGKSPEEKSEVGSVADIKGELQTIKDDIKAKQDELSALINGRSVCEHKLEAKMLLEDVDIDPKKSETTVTDILDTAERIVSSLNGKKTIADESDYIPSFSETKSFALTIEGKKVSADEITIETKSLEDSISLQDSQITNDIMDSKAETACDETAQDVCSGLNGHTKSDVLSKVDDKPATQVPASKSDETPAHSANECSSKPGETSPKGDGFQKAAETGSSIEGVGYSSSQVISDITTSISDTVSAIGSLIPGDIIKSSTSSDKDSVTASPELSRKSDDVSSTKVDLTKGLELKLDSVKHEVAGILESVVSQGSEKSGDISGSSSKSGEKLTETTDKKSSLSSTQVEPPTDKDLPILSGIAALKKEFSSRSETPASDILSDKDVEIGRVTPFSDRSSEQVSRAITHVWETVEGRPESRHYDSDDDIPGSPMSISSHIPSPPQFEYDAGRPQDPLMMSSFYGSLPGDFDDTKPGDLYDYGLHDRGSEGSLKKELGDKLSSIRSSLTSTPESSPLPDRRFDPLVTKESATPPVAGAQVSVTSAQAPLPSVPAPVTTVPSSIATVSPPLPTEPSTQPPTSAPSASTLPGSLPSSSAPSIPDPIGKWDKPLGLPPPHSTDSSTPYLRWNPYKEWGKPLGLPSPAPPPVREDTDVEVDTSGGSAKTTPKKVARMNAENNKYNAAKETSNKTRRSESPVKKPLSKDRKSGPTPVYMDLSYVPHHGNSNYATVEFFKRVRARYYVFSGTEPSKEVFNALLEAKQSWEDKDLEVTIIPTYDTDTLGYWIAENEETLSKLKIDLSPSASRCTINLQDHDTSCSAYRLEF